MDATPGSKKRARSPAAEDASPPVQQMAEPSPPPGATAGGAGGEADDEQVERFYALLDRIRAMRGMFKTTGGTATGRKRARAAREEPPWRPAFRIEDFEEPEDEVDTGALPVCARKRKEEEEKEKEEEGSGSARRPAAGRETAGTDGVADEEEVGEVVESPGTRRVSRRGWPC